MDNTVINRGTTIHTIYWDRIISIFIGIIIGWLLAQ